MAILLFLLLSRNGREVIPEVLPLWLGSSARVVGSLDEPVEGVCGAARAELHVLADLHGVSAGLRCEVRFRYLFSL